MKISIAVTVHNEGAYFRNLSDKLFKFIEQAKKNSPHTYEIVILDDYSTDIEVQTELAHIIDDCGEATNQARVIRRRFDGDFSTHKNYLNSQCVGDWILQHDADENIPDDILFNIPAIIESNPTIDAYRLPRVNTVDGLTLAHVRQWHWVLTTLPEFVQVKAIDPSSEEYKLLKEYNYIISEENGFVKYHQPIVMWPDFQMRLYKNDPKIKWEGKVHETLTGFEHYTLFPAQVDWAIRHHKQIKRQVSQNELYDTITR